MSRTVHSPPPKSSWFSTELWECAGLSTSLYLPLLGPLSGRLLIPALTKSAFVVSTQGSLPISQEAQHNLLLLLTSLFWVSNPAPGPKTSQPCYICSLPSSHILVTNLRMPSLMLTRATGPASATDALLLLSTQGTSPSQGLHRRRMHDPQHSPYIS